MHFYFVTVPGYTIVESIICSFNGQKQNLTVLKKSFLHTFFGTHKKKIPGSKRPMHKNIKETFIMIIIQFAKKNRIEYFMFILSFSPATYQQICLNNRYMGQNRAASLKVINFLCYTFLQL